MDEDARDRGGGALKLAMDRGAACPSCGLEPPEHYVGRHGAAVEWAQAWGHRCPHGEPCVAGADPGELVPCRECVPVVADLFRCDVYAVTLTRSSCAKRHEQANDGAPTDRVAYSGCVDCPIGAAHRRGEKPTADAPQPTPAIKPEDLVRPKRRTRREESMLRDQFAPSSGPARSTGSSSVVGGRQRDGERPPPAAGGTGKSSGTDDAVVRVEATVPEQPSTKRALAGAQEEPTMKKCVLCKTEFTPARSTSKFCDGHTASEKQTWYDRERKKRENGNGGGPAKAAEPETRVSDDGPRLAPAEVLRALGWHVDELGIGPNGRALFAVGSEGQG